MTKASLVSLSLLSSTAAALLFLPMGSPTVLAQSAVESPTISTARAQASLPQTSSPLANTRLSFRQLLRRLFPDDEREDPPTISRGDFCLLAPALPGEETVIWHQRPVFVWRGMLGRLEVVDEATGEVMWQYYPVDEEILRQPSAETFVVYDGASLQAGRTYRWRVYRQADDVAADAFPPFTILPAVNRLLIANGLSVAESKPAGEDGSGTLARAQYFAFRNLPVDALQSLFLVDAPTNEFVVARSEIVERLCD